MMMTRRSLYWRRKLWPMQIMLVMMVVVVVVVKLCLSFSSLTHTITNTPSLHTIFSNLQWTESNNNSNKDNNKENNNNNRDNNNNNKDNNNNNNNRDNNNNNNNKDNNFTLPVKGYTVPNCPCIRFGLDVKGLDEARRRYTSSTMHFSNYPKWFLEKFGFHGHSTCSDYSTQRGGGQKVVSYSYYDAANITDPDSVHYKKYFGQLHGRARVIGKIYPGWIMRVYHNVTPGDTTATKFLCNIVCTHGHVDLCDVTTLPELGNLVDRGVVGRLWRFAVMGDPTVDTFLVRDTDSWVLKREVVVVRQWLQSDKEFHVIRDHPHHRAVMLAGLWGGHNRRKRGLARVRDAMFNHPTNLTLKFDQHLLATKLWPYIKNLTLQHDSYNCLMKTHQGSIPFPVKRVDGLYCGWGPFKFNERRKLFNTRCPLECRPPGNHTWTYC